MTCNLGLKEEIPHLEDKEDRVGISAERTASAEGEGPGRAEVPGQRARGCPAWSSKHMWPVTSGVSLVIVVSWQS